MRTDAKAFEAVLTGRSPAIAEVARKARALVLDVLPEVFEVVWAVQKNAGYGTGPKKQTEHFCWISPASAHVTLGFNYGTELPDPGQLLEGTGKKFRHLKLATVADVDRPAVRALIKAATTHRVPPAKPVEG